jgi:hypothetical protein
MRYEKTKGINEDQQGCRLGLESAPDETYGTGTGRVQLAWQYVGAVSLSTLPCTYCTSHKLCPKAQHDNMNNQTRMTFT